MDVIQPELKVHSGPFVSGVREKGWSVEMESELRKRFEAGWGVGGGVMRREGEAQG